MTESTRQLVHVVRDSAWVTHYWRPGCVYTVLTQVTQEQLRQLITLARDNIPWLANGTNACGCLEKVVVVGRIKVQ